MTIELSEYVIDAIADAIVKKMQVPTEEEKALLQKWRDNRGISMKDFEDAMEALEQEPCEDAISRQAVLEQINCWIGSGEYRYTNATHYLARRMQDLPPVTPQPKTGHWIYSRAVNTGEIVFSECSVCGNGESGCALRMNYCPNCGVKMIKPQESEG